MSKKRTIWLCVVCLISTAAVICIVQISVSGRENTPAWNTDLKTTYQQAHAIGKLLLVEFSAAWCGPCQRMKATTLLDPSIAWSLKKYVLVSIDVDAYPELAAQLDVETIPQFFIIDSKSGKILKENRIGAMPPEDFLAWLNTDNDLSLNEVLPDSGGQSLSTTR